MFTSLTKTTYTGPIIAHGTLFVYCYPAVNQTLTLIVLDGFEPPALIQTRPLFKLRPLFGHIRYFLSGHSPEQPGLGPLGATPTTVELVYTPRGTAALHPGD